MHTLVLLPASGQPELLPHGTKLEDVFEGPVYTARVDAKGCKLFWSTSAYTVSEVNGCATAAAGQLVKGDACMSSSMPAPGALAWLHELKATSAKYMDLLTHPRRRPSSPHGSSARSPSSPARSLIQFQEAASSAWPAQGVSPTATPGLHPLAQQTPARPQPQPAPRYRLQEQSGRARNRTTDPDTHPHPAYGVNSCEPHQQLLYTIMGRVTSTSYTPPERRAPPTPQDPGTSSRGSNPPPVERPPSPTGDPFSSQLPGGSSGFLEAETRGVLDAETFLPSDEAGKPAGSRPPPSRVPVVDWEALPGELLLRAVFEHCQTEGLVAAAAVAVSGVCRGWRSAVLAEKPGLLAMRCRIDPARPFLGSGGRPGSKGRVPTVPAVVLQAAKHGNAGACVTAAQMSEALGRPAEAFPFWAKAARRGDPEGQARVGEAYYRGLFGMPVDGEEAMLWCSRAAKQLLALQETPAESSGEGSAGNPLETPVENFAGGPVGDMAPGGLGLDVIGGVHAEGRGVLGGGVIGREGVLGGTALLLGFLYLDGEATKQDAGQAVKWFKVAAGNGSKDALKVLGMLFNTGQYG